MTDHAPPTPLFGLGILPAAAEQQRAFALARLADAAGLDFITVQDHPYNPTFFDTWTLLAVLGAATQRARLLPNVLNLPLRPPAMLAKAAATLDRLTGGRVELGLGTGAFWEGVAAYGGPQRTPGEAVAALDEAMQIMRALWQAPAPGQAVTFAGQYYQLEGAQPGPAPAHPIGIWLGALKPRLLRLTGRQADGWIVSSPYVPPDDLAPLHALIDEGAAQAGRPPTAIRRAYNVPGLIQAPGQMRTRPARPGVIVGPAQQWVDELVRYHQELRMDTFFFSAAGGDPETQARLFAEEVVPAARQALGGAA